MRISSDVSFLNVEPVLGLDNTENPSIWLEPDVIANNAEESSMWLEADLIVDNANEDIFACA